MHSDVLELFIIVNSVPVLHLTQKQHEDSDTVLKAGRISAQDMLGEETTGELIQKEVLSDSTIFYGREDNILVALRVANSMSQEGTARLLENVINQVKTNRELVYISFGDRNVLQPLIKRLQHILGSKLPTNPFSMAKINHLMEDYMERLPYVDRVGLVTQEGWVVNISESNYSNLAPLNRNVWKHAVEILHLPLGERNHGAILKDNQSLWWIKPIYYEDGKSVTGISWWAFVAQVNIMRFHEKERKPVQKGVQFFEQTNLSSFVFRKVENEVNLGLFKTIAPLIRKMVERETRSIGRTGAFGKLISYAEYETETIVRLRRLDSSVAVVIENEEGIVSAEVAPAHRPLFDSRDPMQLFVREIPEVLRDMKTQTIFITLDTEDFMSLLAHYAGQLTEKGEFHVGLGLEMRSNIDLLQKTLPSLSERGKVILYQDELLPLEDEIKGMVNELVITEIDAEISQYLIFFSPSESSPLSLILYQESTNRYYGFLSTEPEKLGLIKNYLDAFKEGSS